MFEVKTVTVDEMVKSILVRKRANFVRLFLRSHTLEKLYFYIYVTYSI